MLRAFVVNTGRLIEPFNEPAHKAAFAGTTIGAHIDLIFARRNMQRIDIGPSDRIPEGEPAIVLEDTCFVSDKCFGADKGPIRVSVDALALTDGRPYVVDWVPGKHQWSDPVQRR
jgi:hypothetical protein